MGMKNKQSGFSLVGIIVIVIAVALLGTLGYIGYKNFVANDKASSQFGDYGYIPNGKPFPPLVTGVEYVPAGMSDQEAADYLGKYAKVPGLSDALEKIAKHNPCTVTEGRFKQKVLGVTEDQTQALIGNSCGSTGFMRSFMIKQDGDWIRVGSSNGKFNDQEADNSNFNMILDTPSCNVVDKYDIQKTLAPLCFTKQEGENNLFAGDNGNYRYVLR
jgi:hypothetical protein